MALNKTKRNPDSPLLELAKTSSVCGGISLIAAAALMCVTAIILANADVPFDLHQPITTILTSLATFASTYFTGRKKQKSGLIMGLSAGGLVFLVLFLLSQVFGDRLVSEQALIKLAAIVSAGGIGGMVGVNKTVSKKRTFK